MRFVSNGPTSLAGALGLGGGPKQRRTIATSQDICFNFNILCFVLFQPDGRPDHAAGSSSRQQATAERVGRVAHGWRDRDHRGGQVVGPLPRTRVEAGYSSFSHPIRPASRRGVGSRAWGANTPHFVVRLNKRQRHTKLIYDSCGCRKRLEHNTFAGANETRTLYPISHSNRTQLALAGVV